jgi:hypothetical protein
MSEQPAGQPAGQRLTEEPGTDRTARLRFPPRLAVPLIIALVIAAGGSFLSHAAKPIASSEVVKTRRAIPAFRTIAKADVLVVRVVAPPPAAIASANAVVGQVTTTAIRRGELLTDRMVVQLAPDRRSWPMLAIATVGSEVIAQGATVTVLGIDANGKATTISTNALALGTQSGQVMVAMPLDQASRAASYRAEKRQLVVLQVVATKGG